MRKVSVLLALTALAACESQAGASPDVAMVRAAATAMEDAGSFAVDMTIDLQMPEGLTSVKSTIDGRVDLSNGRSTSEGQSDDGDAWSERVVDGVAYRSRGEIVNAPDWCALPVSEVDANALIQTGSNFADVPDLLRSVEDVSVAADASTADSTAYRVTVPERESSSAAIVDGDELTLWLDDAGRPVQAEFAISQPVAGASEPAVAQVRWVLSDWGSAKIGDIAPADDEVEHSPDCFF